VRISLVGIGGVGSLATAFTNAAAELGHEATLVEAPELVGGSRKLFLARRIGTEAFAAKSLIERLHNDLTSTSPDFVVVIKGRFLRAETVAAMRQSLGVPFVNYYPDHPLWPRYGEAQIAEALAAYDEIIVWADHVREALVDAGCPAPRVIPFGYDPTVYRPSDDAPRRRWDVTLIGQFYDERLRYAEALTEFDLFVSGRGWTRGAKSGQLAGRISERSFPGDETCRLYWRSAIGLNILAESNVPAHNMRTFELPASGTAMIATWTPEHHELFGSDGAVLVSEPREAREAVRALLADPDRLAAIRDEGRRRVTPHTYAERLGVLLAPWVPHEARLS
jgi:spore maturation protein CgeB